MKQKFRRRFRAMILLQVLLIAGTLALMIVATLRGGLVAVPVLLGMLAVLQVGLLLRSVHAHVDALEDFFAAINYQDFSRRFVENDVEDELREAFNRILERFQDARAAGALQADYLDLVVRHVPVPLIATRNDGSLSIANNLAKRLTGISSLKHLDDLATQDARLPAILRQIPAGRQRLVQTRLRDVPVELRVSVSQIRLAGEVERLYSIENISGELSARESSAWRNLIRVLTHEIMNTLTPVTSLAQTTAGMLDDPQATDDIREAIQTIGRRSEGLMNFVAKYRELMHLPVPELAPVAVRELLDGLLLLEKDALGKIDVHVEVQPASLKIDVDRQLIEQLLINLLKNAIEALRDTESPIIRVRATLDYGRTLLVVEDNGPGIPEDIRDQLFIPFFTTKREGSGIGLSLSRQIMSAHGGDIVLESSTQGTQVKLVFV